MNFDIAIIGGGPAGYTAAERAGANGLRAVLFEKKAIGGVCLNEGCIPTKKLLYSAKILDSIKSASKYGISAESPSFDLTKIMSRKEKTVKMLTGGVKMTMNSYGVGGLYSLVIVVIYVFLQFLAEMIDRLELLQI